MKATLRKHLWYYGVGAIFQGLGLLLIILSSGFPHIQMTYVVLMAFFYVLWGILHHIFHHDLHTKIVLEYVLFASLGITVIYFLLQ